MYRVKDLYEKHAQRLNLELITGEAGMTRRITTSEVQRPGLSLCGYLKHYSGKSILVFDKLEMSYLRDLHPQERIERLTAILTPSTPAVMMARRYNPSKELKSLCETKGIPFFKTSLTAVNLLSTLTLLLNEEFAPGMSCHGTLVEVFGVGILIQGDSAVGKSEAALGLIERGHSLVSDDIVKVKKKEGIYLEGYGAPLTQHHMEIRGIGIINVAYLYGSVCVRNHKSIDIVVRLEVWDNDHFYDRIGLDEKFITLLDVKLPYLVLPVKPGRDVVLLLETIALNHRLREMGYHSAQEFSTKLLELTMARRRKKMALAGDQNHLISE